MAISLRAVMGYDGSVYEAGLRRAHALAGEQGAKIGKSFGSAIKSRLAMALGPAALMSSFVAITKSAINYASELKDLSEQHDMTIEETQKLGEVARGAGLSFEKYVRTLDLLGQKRKDAVEGNEELRKQFAAYGVTLNDLLNPQQRNIQLLEKMGVAISKIKLTPQQRAELKELGITPALANSLGNFGTAKADLSDGDVQNADRFNKEVENLSVKARSGVVKEMSKGMSNLKTMWSILLDPSELIAGIIEPIKPSQTGKRVPTPQNTGHEDATINGKTIDPLFLKQEAELAASLNKLYEKGLQIQYERLSAKGKEKELLREIKALEISAEEQADSPEGDKVRRQIAIKQAELGLFQQQAALSSGLPNVGLTERQRMGDYSSGASNRLLSINEGQLAELQMIRKAMKPTVSKPEGLGIITPN